MGRLAEVCVALVATAVVLVACGSSERVLDTTSETSAAVLEEESSSDEGIASDAEADTAPGSTAAGEPPSAGFILEPANAQLDGVPGWTDVDEWYWEPISFSRSPDCAALNEVLALEEWGVITTFRLRDGAELYHHTSELNTADNVQAFVDAFLGLPDQCPVATIGDASIAISAATAAGATGVELAVDGRVDPTWFFESDSASRAVILWRNNVVSIVQVVPNDGFDIGELDAIVESAAARLAGVRPEEPESLPSS